MRTIFGESLESCKHSQSKNPPSPHSVLSQTNYRPAGYCDRSTSPTLVVTSVLPTPPPPAWRPAAAAAAGTTRPAGTASASPTLVPARQLPGTAGISSPVLVSPAAAAALPSLCTAYPSAAAPAFPASVTSVKQSSGAPLTAAALRCLRHNRRLPAVMAATARTATTAPATAAVGFGGGSSSGHVV
jgi:hypothetical protein